jgi:hypothetical protein
LHIDWDDDLLDRLAYFHQLRCAGFQLAALRPLVSFIVMANVAKQQAHFAAMNDQPDVAVNPHRPEILVLRFIELVEAHARIGRVKLQVERRRLHSLLLIASQTGEAVSEGVGNSKLHFLIRSFRVFEVRLAFPAADQRGRLGRLHGKPQSGLRSKPVAVPPRLSQAPRYP